MTEKIIYSFAGGSGPSSNGYSPTANLISGPAGGLYGATKYGGPFTSGGGVAYSLTPPSTAGGDWTGAILGGFGYKRRRSKSRRNPDARAEITLYGVTNGGGQNNQGTIYSLAPPSVVGGSWTESVLHTFSATVGAGDGRKLLQGLKAHNRVLYGTILFDGQFDDGTIFAIQP